MAYARKARDHLVRMARASDSAFAKIVKDKEKEFQHWGMTPGDKEGIWTDKLGPERRIVAKHGAIDSAKPISLTCAILSICRYSIYRPHKEMLRFNKCNKA